MNPSHLRQISGIWYRPTEFCDASFNQAPNERSFDDLCLAYAMHGNVAWGEDVARLMIDARPGRRSSDLARLIAQNDIFAFQWRGELWIPMVQFNHEDMSIDPRVQEVRRELGAHLDGWEIASWFVSGNAFLEGRRPVDVLGDALPAVLNAARATGL